jgi:hypothetical protein
MPQQQPYGYGQPAPVAQAHHYPVHRAAPEAQAKGFFGSLFDFSFTSLVTPRVVKVLYVLFLVGLVLYILGGLGYAVFMMINEQFLMGLVSLVVLPFAIILMLIFGRMYHELIILAFRIAEDLSEINKKTRG